MEGRFAHIGQLAEFIDAVLSTKEKYYLPGKCRITGCMRVSTLGGYFKRLPGYANYFATGYSLHPAGQLFLDEYRKHLISELDRCGGGDKLNDGRYAWEVFDDFIEKIRKRAKEIKLKSKIRDWDSRYRKNRASLDDQLAELLDRYESLMVIRLDIHHGRFWLNPTQLEEFLIIEQMRRISEKAAYFAGADLVPEHGPHLLVDLPEVKEDLTRFLASRKGKRSLFKHFVGYAWRIECSDPGGFHVHMVLYFKGSKVRQHKWLAQRIGEYWRDKITKGRGRFHNCNLDWDESSPQYGVGMVRRKDFKKIRVLRNDVLGYLCKKTQQVWVRPYTQCHTFGTGMLQRGRAKNRGRRRSESGHRHLEVPSKAISELGLLSKNQRLMEYMGFSSAMV